jgi:hypothetical protein
MDMETNMIIDMDMSMDSGVSGHGHGDITKIWVLNISEKFYLISDLLDSLSSAL